MNILITGGAGFLGSVLSHKLLDAGHRVRVLDNLWFGGESLLGLMLRKGFEFHRGDVRSCVTTRRCVADVDAVVHLAAMVGEPHCRQQPAMATEINQQATVHLFEDCCRLNVKRFVFASTCSNYGRSLEADQILTEESPLCPLGIYAESKVAAEQELFARRGATSVTVLRFATLYGLSPRMRFDLTVNHFAMELLNSRRLTLFQERAWRPYLHVGDAARAILSVLSAPDSTVGNRVFNIGDSRENYTKLDLVRMITAKIGGKFDIQVGHLDDDARDYRVDFERFHSTLDFQTARRVSDGISEIVALLRAGIFPDAAHQRYRNDQCRLQ